MLDRLLDLLRLRLRPPLISMGRTMDLLLVLVLEEDLLEAMGICIDRIIFLPTVVVIVVLILAIFLPTVVATVE